MQEDRDHTAIDRAFYRPKRQRRAFRLGGKLGGAVCAMLALGGVVALAYLVEHVPVSVAHDQAAAEFQRGLEIGEGLGLCRAAELVGDSQGEQLLPDDLAAKCAAVRERYLPTVTPSYPNAGPERRA